jgi:hypothetical protein
MLLSPVNDVTNALSGNLHALLDGVATRLRLKISQRHFTAVKC